MLIKARDCFPVELGRQAAGLRALQQAGFTKRDCPTLQNVTHYYAGARVKGFGMLLYFA
jgi:hypothetical protein